VPLIQFTPPILHQNCNVLVLLLGYLNFHVALNKKIGNWKNECITFGTNTLSEPHTFSFKFLRDASPLSFYLPISNWTDVRATFDRCSSVICRFFFASLFLLWLVYFHPKHFESSQQNFDKNVAIILWLKNKLLLIDLSVWTKKEDFCGL
jgi:hypothetical protein